MSYASDNEPDISPDYTTPAGPDQVTQDTPLDQMAPEVFQNTRYTPPGMPTGQPLWMQSDRSRLTQTPPPFQMSPLAQDEAQLYQNMPQHPGGLPIDTLPFDWSNYEAKNAIEGQGILTSEQLRNPNLAQRMAGAFIQSIPGVEGLTSGNPLDQARQYLNPQTAEERNSASGASSDAFSWLMGGELSAPLHALQAAQHLAPEAAMLAMAFKAPSLMKWEAEHGGPGINKLYDEVNSAGFKSIQEAVNAARREVKGNANDVEQALLDGLPRHVYQDIRDAAQAVRPSGYPGTRDLREFQLDEEDPSKFPPGKEPPGMSPEGVPTNDIERQTMLFNRSGGRAPISGVPEGSQTGGLLAREAASNPGAAANEALATSQGKAFEPGTGAALKQTAQDFINRAKQPLLNPQSEQFKSPALYDIAKNPGQFPGERVPSRWSNLDNAIPSQATPPPEVTNPHYRGVNLDQAQRFGEAPPPGGGRPTTLGGGFGDGENPTIKIAKGVASELGAVTKTLAATGDVSASLRQSLPFIIAHPIASGQAFAKQLKAIAMNPQDYAAYQADFIKQHANAIRDGIYMGHTGGGLESGAEQFTSTWLNHVPVLRTIVGRSEQAFLAMTNEVRVRSFEGLVDGYRAAGQPLDDAARQDIARLMNAASGRGYSAAEVTKVLGGQDSVARAGLRLLNNYAFSPQMAISRPRFIARVATGAARMTADMARGRPINPADLEAVRLGAGYMASVTAIYMMVSAATGSDQPDLNPVSSNFGKIDLGEPSNKNAITAGIATELGVGVQNYDGHVWIDPGAGVYPDIKLLARTLTGMADGAYQAVTGEQGPLQNYVGASGNEGDTTDLTNPTQESVGDVITQFAKSKASPLMSRALQHAFPSRARQEGSMFDNDAVSLFLLPMLGLQDVIQAGGWDVPDQGPVSGAWK